MQAFDNRSVIDEVLTKTWQLTLPDRGTLCLHGSLKSLTLLRTQHLVEIRYIDVFPGNNHD